MSIAVLGQVHEEVRRLLIAGSLVAPGDFRLKKLIPPLEQSGAKAPVFAKVAQAAQAVVDSNEKTASAALLELAQLTSAILYTQGETGAAGDLKAIETQDLGMSTSNVSARLVKTLLDALQKTGSGRLETIREAAEFGAFQDIRLVTPALAALDDVYAEIGDFIAESILPMYGKSILPQIQKVLDIKGRGGHCRRLALWHKLDPEGARATVREALDSGSKEMRVVATECLGDSDDDFPFLSEQVKSRAKDVRIAALRSLARMSRPEALALVQKALSGADRELVNLPEAAKIPPATLAAMITLVRDEVAAWLKEKDKKAAETAAQKLLTLLNLFAENPSPDVAKLLTDLFAQKDKIRAVKGDPSGGDVALAISRLMSTCNTATQKLLVAEHADLPGLELAYAFSAAGAFYSPKQLYDAFAPYVEALSDKKKKESGKGKIIIDEILENYRWMHYGYYHRRKVEIKEWDPRWLDLFVKTAQADLILKFARPGHKECLKWLSDRFTSQVKKATSSYDVANVLEAMHKAEHPDLLPSIIASIRKINDGKSYWGMYHLNRLITTLPKSVIPEFEKLLPELNERIADDIVGSLQTLREKPE